MAIPALLLEVQVIDRRTGLWCDPCALPSVVEVDAVLVTRQLTVLARSTCWRCTDCGACGVRQKGGATP